MLLCVCAGSIRPGAAHVVVADNKAKASETPAERLLARLTLAAQARVRATVRGVVARRRTTARSAQTRLDACGTRPADGRNEEIARAYSGQHVLSLVETWHSRATQHARLGHGHEHSAPYGRAPTHRFASYGHVRHRKQRHDPYGLRISPLVSMPGFPCLN